MIHIMICDDEPEFAKKLTGMVKTVLDGMNETHKIYAVQRKDDITEQMYLACDLVFLDIDLASADYNGMDIARKVREYREDAAIVFVTNFIEYAPEGYEVRAFRYILKRDIMAGSTGFIREAVEHFKSNGKIFKINIEGEVINLPIDDILYMTVQHHNTIAVLKKKSPKQENKTYCFRISLSEVEGKLEALGFLRTHKSYLVNMRYIRKLHCREVTLTNGDVLPVGEKNYAEQKKKYLLWRGLK